MVTHTRDNAHDLMPIVLQKLERLVSFDTCNPPRNFSPDDLSAYVQSQLPDFEHSITDHGEGRISHLMVRGDPKLLFNVHVDTVPSANNWTQDPWTLTVTEHRAVGLGACDIKGAAACLMSVAQHSKAPLALLFTSDEEAGNSHCVREFLATDKRFKRVVVAEPTGSLAVRAHRGIITGTVEFSGAAGHASAQQGIGASALHQAVDWSHRALAWAQAQEEMSFENLSGLRFNIGTLNGGVKPNMIAPSATLRFGLRSLPGGDQSALIESLQAICNDYPDAVLTPGFVAPSLNCSDSTLCDDLSAPLGEAVNFWTEAALFAADGRDSVVWGPGDIAQAHTADEWVALDQLATMTMHYLRMLDHELT